MKKIIFIIMLGLTLTLAACLDSEPSVPTDPVAPETDTADPVEDANNHDDETTPAPSQPSDDQNSDSMVPSDDTEAGDDTDDAESDAEDDLTQDIPTDDDGLYLLTLSQLSLFDGKEGRRAFIAVAGVVYEVTNSLRWANGIHNGNPNIAAGNDLTRLIDSSSPHGRRVLDGVPVVGRIVQE
jgi:predicted heme/steroid binding protein